MSDPNTHESPQQQHEDQPTAVSRRGLLKGAAVAAGALGLPLLGSQRAEGTDLLTALAGRVQHETGAVSGRWLPAFERVRDKFVRNFAERGEVGASCCVMLGGAIVVDLWGGIADPATSKPWGT